MLKNTKRGNVAQTKGSTSKSKSSKGSAATLNSIPKRKEGEIKVTSGKSITSQRDRYAVNDARSSKGNKTHMMARNQHVVPHDGAWAVQKEGGNKVVIFEVKSDAIDAARKIARRQGSDLVVHGLNGQIFQRSDAPSTISENKIREVIRAAAKKTPTRSSKGKRLTAKSSALATRARN